MGYLWQDWMMYFQEIRIRCLCFDSSMLAITACFSRFLPVLYRAQGLSCALQSFLFTAMHPPKTECSLLPTSQKPLTDPVTSCAFPSSQHCSFWELLGEVAHRIVNNWSSPFGYVRLLSTLDRWALQTRKQYQQNICPLFSLYIEFSVYHSG